MTTEHIQEMYEALGGVFVTPPVVLQEKLQGIKAFLFDWDGVFNDGRKGGGQLSGFSETDSMGTNLFRFGMWLKNQQKQVPFAIISGAHNKAAYQFAQRENWDSVYYRIPFKVAALEHFAAKHGLNHDEIAFVFDDILDLNTAKLAGLRFFIRKKELPLFNQVVISNYCDYATANPGDRFGVREISELCMGLSGQFETLIDKRMAYYGDYETYMVDRKTGNTDIYTFQEGAIIEKAPPE